MSNLLKSNWVVLKNTEKRIIDSNDLVSQKVEQYTNFYSQIEEVTTLEANGFKEGIVAEEIECTYDPEQETLPTAEELHFQAMQEIELMKSEALQEIETMKMQALQDAKEQGYQEGKLQAEEECAILRQKCESERVAQLRLFQEKEEELNQAYHTKMEELEPLFIEKITGIYEHIFHIDLSPYRDMVIYLLSNTIRNIENSRDFIIHLSKEDYPFVIMQKTQIISSLSANVTVEMIEDITLATGECYIETLGGIFDCGIDSQLQELGKELKLLSYE